MEFGGESTEAMDVNEKVRGGPRVLSFPKKKQLVNWKLEAIDEAVVMFVCVSIYRKNE